MGGGSERTVKLAILGTRGVPAAYGGFETLAEELGRRLAERGHEVTVYGRSGFVDPSLASYRGMRLVVLPAIRSKHLETVSHTFLSALHASWQRFDVVLLCNAANAPFVRILQAARVPVALNVDGLERKRRKWGLLGRSYYRVCERLAALTPDRVVTDAEVIRRYYRRVYRAASTMIAYGGDLEPPERGEILARLGLAPGEYLLYVSRFEAENNPDRVAAAYGRVSGERRLVMVGGAPYAPELTERVRRAAAGDPRILLPGAVYGDGYRELLFNCRLYVHATEVGGTHPALVEAMGAGRPVVVLDTPENREVVGGAGLGFRFAGPRSLELRLAEVVDQPERLAALAAASRQRVTERYLWRDVTDAYEHLLEGLC
jgi:glycosyltransferase involved in cell wall biosynthesis